MLNFQANLPTNPIQSTLAKLQMGNRQRQITPEIAQALFAARRQDPQPEPAQQTGQPLTQYQVPQNDPMLSGGQWIDPAQAAQIRAYLQSQFGIGGQRV